MDMDQDKPVTFKDLGVCDQLAEACDNLGWKVPSEIQLQAIPHALAGRDLIGLAQTGSGKTGAFALPILQSLLAAPKPLFACVLSPTRELAIQIAAQFEALGAGIGVKCALLVGGVDEIQQERSLAKRPHIVVATPDHLLEHLQTTEGFTLRTLKYLVLDEADRLLNMEFEVTIYEILDAIPRDRRTYLFSAIMTEEVKELGRASLHNPVRIVAPKQQYCCVPSVHKDFYLVYILTVMSGNTSMIFTCTCESTRLLALILRNLGFRAIPINAQMTQTKRLAALNRFKSGKYNILVASDVAGRGPDIPPVDTVINYDIPSNSKDYFHRVGRTARDGRDGLAIALVSQYDVAWYMQIEELIEKRLPRYDAKEEEVWVLFDRVLEAKNLSARKLKESTCKRRKNRDEEEDELDEEQ